MQAISTLGIVASMPQPAEHARVQLIAEQKVVASGATTHIGLLFEIDRGWHLYFDGMNDSGFAPQASWKAPEGVKMGEILWPAPKRYTMPGDLLDHVYEGRLLLMVPVEIPEEAASGTRVRIEAEVDWLVCSDVCLPGFGEVSIELPVGPAQAGEHASEFEKVREALPKRVAEDTTEVAWRWSGDVLEIRTTKAKRTAFYPRRGSRKPMNLLGDGEAKGSTLRLKFERPTAERANVEGILEIEDQDGGFGWFDLEVEPGKNLPRA